MSELVELTSRLDTVEVKQLLFYLVGWRDDEALNRAALTEAVNQYRTMHNISIWGIEQQGRLVGLVGIDLGQERRTVIRHIVVHPDHRGMNVGRELVKAVLEQWPINEVAAETDATAVGFYRKCGFAIVSLGEKYPGVERFHCFLRTG